METGWSRYWNTARYFERRPFLTEAAARFLVPSGAVLVGIDSANIDDAKIYDGRFTVLSLNVKSRSWNA